MYVTIKLIQERYNVLNNMCFSNELPTNVRFLLHDSFKLLGQYSYTLNRYNEVTRHSISISRNYDWDGDMLDDIILHEMIHEYIYYYQLKIGRNTHGAIFIKFMNEFNQKFGRNIAVRPPLSAMTPVPGTSKLKWWFVKTFTI